MMEDKERANIILRRIGEMPYFDPDAIVKVLVNEFELVRKESAQPSVQEVCQCGARDPKLKGYHHFFECPMWTREGE